MRSGLFIITFCLSFFNTQAQDSSYTEEDLRFVDHVYVGGEAWFNINAKSVFFSISPFAGYYITPKLSVGPGTLYQWQNYRVALSPTQDTIINDHIVGGSGFVRYRINDQFIAHAEYQIVNTKVYDPFEQRDYRRNVPVFMIGGGWRYNLGPKSFMQFLFLYDVVNDRDSPYPKYYGLPIIMRTGFIFQLGSGMPQN